MLVTNSNSYNPLSATTSGINPPVGNSQATIVDKLNRSYYSSPLHKAPSISTQDINPAENDDRVHEKCGVFGVYKFPQTNELNPGEVFGKTLSGLLGLQHRGQEAAGIATFTNKDLNISKGGGTVTEFFKKNSFFEAIKEKVNYFMDNIGFGSFKNIFNETFKEHSKDFSMHNYANQAIGHVLYATSKAGERLHAQPIQEGEPPLVLVHNGNLPDTTNLKNFLLDKGIPANIINDSNDSELMAKTIAQFQKEIIKERAEANGSYKANGESVLAEAIKKAAPMFKGAYSLIIMNQDEMIALRDPQGIRPFSLGVLDKNAGIVFSSEDSTFPKIGAKPIRDIQPGEMIRINQKTEISKLNNTQELIFRSSEIKPHIDAFEFVYFARPDSTIAGVPVYEARTKMGSETAKEFIKEHGANLNPENTVVVPVYESGKHAAHSFAAQLKLPVVAGLMKNFSRRTFIDGGAGIDDKFSVIKEAVKGKDLLVIDDSIVRGNTSKNIITKLKEAGAKSVSLISTAPPVVYPDFYGIDTPEQDKLIAAKAKKANPDASPKELNQIIAKDLGADSVFYLSLDGLVKSIGIEKNKLNLAAFNGEYPVELGERAKGVKQYAGAVG